ncbi:unnamed protein product [Sphagnum jensenii]|uniref:Uncharacterized protein n=1 Tax=Sphagnum jensenii TaxID=128206 RepID=A0ABP1AE24_9BRYO
MHGQQNEEKRKQQQHMLSSPPSQRSSPPGNNTSSCSAYKACSKNQICSSRSASSLEFPMEPVCVVMTV